MKRLGLLLILLIASTQLSSVLAYPRHVDPSQYELAEPDPDILFLVYHNLYLGMIFENLTIQEEWLEWASQMYSVPDLSQLLNEYGDQINGEVINLNLTRFYLDEALRYVGDFNLAGARASFLQGLLYLDQSNQNIPVLRGTTNQIGSKLNADPEILLEDLDQVQALIDEYADLAQLLMNYLNGEEVDLEEVKDILDDFLDEDYLESLDGVNIESLKLTSMSLALNTSSCWVGSPFMVTGRLSASGLGLENRIITLEYGRETTTIVTGDNGYYAATLRAPYIYRDEITVTVYYWPKGEDVKQYTPAKADETLTLLYLVPSLELDYSAEAYPGLDWSLKGALGYRETGIDETEIHVIAFGGNHSSITVGDGLFNLNISVPSDTQLGVKHIFVSSEPSGVYSGVSEELDLTITKIPIVLDVRSGGFIFSGFKYRLSVSVTSDGMPIDGCALRMLGEDDSSVGYSHDGDALIGVWVPLFRTGGDYNWRLYADPAEPWLADASISGGFMVVNSIVALFTTLLLGVALYLLRDYLEKRGGVVTELGQITEYVEPLQEPEPVHAEYDSVFLVGLRIIEHFSGVNMAPSDTLREYLGRVLGRLSKRLGDLFTELVQRYERWLYGKPDSVEIGEVEELVAEMEESDEI